MPKKKTKKKGGAGKKAKKGVKAVAEKEEIKKKCSQLLKIYQQRCMAMNSTASQGICQACRECIENEKALVKFVLDPSSRDATSKRKSQPSSSAKTRASSSLERAGTAQKIPVQLSSATPLDSGRPPLLLQPLTNSWVEVRYNHMKVLHVWSMALSDDAVVSLSLFFESPVGSNLKVLELRDTSLTTWAIRRLARSLKSSQLSVLNLDYNNLQCEAMTELCECLQAVPSLHFLSLDYCTIDSSCCEALGTLIAMAQIKELSLIGNSIGCDGCTELMRPLVTICESSVDETAAVDKITSDQNEGNEQLPRRQPHPPSPLAKLFLQDNGIDVCGLTTGSGCVPALGGVSGPHTKGLFASIVCMRAVKRWILSSVLLEEINLDGNNLGDGAAREVMIALQERKEVGLPPIRITVSPRVCPEIYEPIIQLSVSHGKKAKKKGKKKKKK